jgi:transcriptional regulator PpsR
LNNLLENKKLKKLSPAELVHAGSDIAVLLDAGGTVLDVSYSDSDLAAALSDDWRGQAWVDTVTDETRGKAKELLETAKRDQPGRWFQLNHPIHRQGAKSGVPPRTDRPVRYCTLKINGGRQLLALGRDLQSIADLQQELISAQETAERDYWRLRQAESRFRLLMQISPDALIVADSSTEQIIEINPVAEQLLADHTIINPSKLGSLFEADSARSAQNLMARALSDGHANEKDLRLRGSDDPASVSMFLLRQGNAGVFVVRIQPTRPQRAETDPETARLLKLIEASPEAIVVTDEAGLIVSCNPAFVALAQLAGREQALGEPLSNWLGRSSVDVNVLLANLKSNDRIRLFNTSVQGAHGVAEDVEVSATSLPEINGGARHCGFLIHSLSRRGGRTASQSSNWTHSIEQLTELVGSVPLKELVRSSADLIERLSIEAALNLTGNNRAAAAEMLGLSRQSLYVKLRRYNIGDPTQGKDGD